MARAESHQKSRKYNGALDVLAAIEGATVWTERLLVEASSNRDYIPHCRLHAYDRDENKYDCQTNRIMR